MPSVYGEFRVNGLPRNGATVNLYYTSAAFSPNNPPQAGDPFPTDDPIGTTTTGPSAGGVGAFRFTNVPSAEYYVGILWDGLYTWQYFNSTNFGASTSGAVTINVPNGFVGAPLLLEQASSNLFKVHTDPTVIPTSGNINESVKTGIDEWFNIINIHGQAPASGMLTGQLDLTVPDNTVFLNVARSTRWPAIASTTPASSLVFPPCGRLEMRIGDEWGLYSQGFTQDFSAGFIGVQNYMVNDVNGVSGYGYSPWWVDHDGQVHCEALGGTPGVRQALGDHGLLILNHSRGIMDTFSSVAIEMGVDHDGSGGGTPQPHGLIQLSYGSTVEGSENANWQFYHPQANLFSTGSIFQRAVELRFDGYLEIESHANRGGLLIQNEPYPSAVKGLISLGTAGFGGLAGGFNGTSAGTYLAVNASGSFTGNFVDLQQAGVSVATWDHLGNLILRNVDNATNTTATPLSVGHNLLGGAFGAAGIGSAIDFRATEGGGADHRIGTLDYYLAAVTPGNFKSVQRTWVASGGITFEASETRWNRNFESFGALYVRKKVDATSLYGNVNIGSGGFGESDAAGTGLNPFSGSANGTLLAVNAASGYTGNLVDAQLAGTNKFKVDSTGKATIAGDLAHSGSNLGVYGTAPIAKQTLTGTKSGGTALANLITALANLGLFTDSTS